MMAAIYIYLFRFVRTKPIIYLSLRNYPTHIYLLVIGAVELALAANPASQPTRFQI
jgi:hypothetical protein